MDNDISDNLSSGMVEFKLRKQGIVFPFWWFSMELFSTNVPLKFFFPQMFHESRKSKDTHWIFQHLIKYIKACNAWATSITACSPIFVYLESLVQWSWITYHKQQQGVERAGTLEPCRTGTTCLFPVCAAWGQDPGNRTPVPFLNILGRPLLHPLMQELCQRGMVMQKTKSKFRCKCPVWGSQGTVCQAQATLKSDFFSKFLLASNQSLIMHSSWKTRPCDEKV